MSGTPQKPNSRGMRRARHWQDLRRDIRELQDTLAKKQARSIADVAQLVSCLNYVRLILGNSRIARFLAKDHPEKLEALQRLIASK